MARPGTGAQRKNRLQGRGLETFKWMRQQFRLVGREARSRPFFIAGVQRSGTNMLSEVLERSFRTDVFRESDPKAHENFELRDLAQLQKLVRRSPADCVVFKALCDLHRLRGLLDAFEGARAIWIVRRMDDMVNSHLRARFARVCDARMRNIADDPESEGWRGRGLGDETLALLRRHAGDGLSHESAVALFWLARNRLYFDHGLESDERVCVLFYEDFVQDPKRRGADLLRWAGLKSTAFALKKVKPSSIGRYPPPSVDPEIAERCTALYDRFSRDARLLDTSAR